MRTVEKKAKRAKRKAEKAARKAAELQQKVEVAADREPKDRRRILVRALGVIVAAGVAGAGYWYYEQDRADDTDRRPAEVTIETFGELGSSIVIRNGIATIDDIANDPAVVDQKLATVDGKEITFARPLVAVDSAYLTIAGRTVRLRSDPEAVVPFVVEGANLTVRNATISSWDGSSPDDVLDDGRAYVEIENSVVDIDNLTLMGLGEPDRGQTGFAITNGSTGSVSDVTSSDSYVGLDLAGDLQELTVADVDVNGAALAGIRLSSVSGLSLTSAAATTGKGDGMLIEGSTSDSMLLELDMGANGGHGVSVTGAGGNLTISQSRMFRNEGRGISVANTRGVTLADNAVWANNGGIAFTGANADATLSGNAITGNRGGGIELASAGTSVSIAGNTIDHNEYGLRIADGTATVESNSIAENGVGVMIEDSSPQASFTLNDITNNYDTGFQLVEADGLAVESNRILRNSHAAFTVRVAAASEPFWADNEVDGGRYGVERIYEPLREDRALADLIPIPAYFYVEEGRAFSDLLQEEQAASSAAGQP